MLAGNHGPANRCKVAGWQALGKRFGHASQVDLAYGRSLYLFRSTSQQRNTQWVRLQGRADVYRGLYLLVDVEYDSGDDLQGPRGFLELGHLF